MYNVDSIVHLCNCKLFSYDSWPNKRKPDWPPSIHNFEENKVSYSRRSWTPFTQNNIITRQVILFLSTGCLEDTLQTLPSFCRYW